MSKKKKRIIKMKNNSLVILRIVKQFSEEFGMIKRQIAHY
jgi:hypothetical protein